MLCVQQYFPCQVHLYYKYVYVFICAFSGFFYNLILLRPCILKHWKHFNKSMTLCILGKISQNLLLESCQPTILFHVLMLTDNVNGQRITHMFVYFIYQRLHFIHGQQITQNFIWSEAVAWSCSVKKVFLKISQISRENTCVGVTLLKKIFDTSVFLWILWSFYEYLFL